MTECDDDRVEREIPDLGDGGGIQTPDPDGAILVTDPTAKYALTARAEFDVHGAICHGLATYVAGLEHAIDGRYLALSRVVTDWADHADGQVPAPSAMVGSVEIGKYQTDSGMAPGDARRLAPDQHGQILSLSCSGMYVLEELGVEVWCSDKIQRNGVRQMLERGLCPVQWMSGFRLVLPRYHSAIAEFLLVTAQQADATDMATAGIRPLTMRLRARCPAYVAHHLPLARPSVTGTIVSGKRRI